MIRIIEMTHDEKVKMYSKFTKAKLIEMLIQCNIHLTAMSNPSGYRIDPINTLGTIHKQ